MRVLEGGSMALKSLLIFRFFGFATFIYILFVIRGLPSHHYLDWSLDFKIGDCIEIILFTVPLTYLVLKWFSRKPDYFKDSLWLALSFSVPYAVYDFIFLGLLKGYGLDYPGTFWFLTIFYLIVLVEIPVIGYLMQRDDREVTKSHLLMLVTAVISWGLNWWEGSFSDHFAAWALNMKIIHLVNVVLILLPVGFGVLQFCSTEAGIFKSACWLALYFSFVFILFDFLYLGIARGHGLSYIVSNWHAAALYPLFWIEIPLIGWVAKGRAARPEPLSVE